MQCYSTTKPSSCPTIDSCLKLANNLLKHHPQAVLHPDSDWYNGLQHQDHWGQDGQQSSSTSGSTSHWIHQAQPRLEPPILLPPYQRETPYWPPLCMPMVLRQHRQIHQVQPEDYPRQPADLLQGQFRYSSCRGAMHPMVYLSCIISIIAIDSIDEQFLQQHPNSIDDGFVEALLAPLLPRQRTLNFIVEGLTSNDLKNLSAVCNCFTDVAHWQFALFPGALGISHCFWFLMFDSTWFGQKFPKGSKVTLSKFNGLLLGAGMTT